MHNIYNVRSVVNLLGTPFHLDIHAIIQSCYCQQHNTYSPTDIGQYLQIMLTSAARTVKYYGMA